MFDRILSELSGKFGLGNKAPQFLNMLLQYICDSGRGGIGGFIDSFKSKGLSSLANSWLGGGNPANEVFPAQVESVIGTHQIQEWAAKLGIEPGLVSKATAGVLPSLIQSLTPDGTIPTSIPSAVADYVMKSGPGGSDEGGAGILPWVLIGGILLVLAYFFLQPSPEKVNNKPGSNPPTKPAPDPANPGNPLQSRNIREEMKQITKPDNSERATPPGEAKSAPAPKAEEKASEKSAEKLEPKAEPKPAEKTETPVPSKPASPSLGTNSATAKAAEKPAEAKPAEKKD